MTRTIVMQLGRLGDVASILPLCWNENRRGNRLTIFIAQEFASLLDGVSYVDRLIWTGPYNRPDMAWHWLKNQSIHRHQRLLNAQAYRHPTDKQHLTKSFQTEGWRLAGKLDEFGCWPLIFDQRDKAREAALSLPFERSGKPIILVGLHSVSSPYPNEGKLFLGIKEAFGKTHEVVDLRQVKAARIFDVLGLMDRAVCLVTVDTVFLHLSTASKVPVVALTNQEKADGWFASVPPPNTLATFGYSIGSAEVIQELTFRLMNKPGVKVIHVVDDHGDTDRHRRARATWPIEESRVRTLYKRNWWRMADDPRKPPFLRDVLQAADNEADKEDVVIWSNSDTMFTPDAVNQIKTHVGLWGACTIRRKEIGESATTHIGRDVFAFRADYLREVVLPVLPDLALAAPCFDLVVAAIVRKARGINSTKENMLLDFFPCELAPGLVLHEPHESSWAGNLEKILPANIRNRELAQAYCKEHMPTLKL